MVLRNDEGRILLGRRSRGDHAGKWCIPCGYVDWNEDIRDAACREMREETGLVIAPGIVLAVHSNFHDLSRQTVGVWFAGEIVAGQPLPGDDLDDLGWFSPGEPPPLAFPTDALVLADLTRR